eukprot:gene643-2078_t
MQRLTLPRCIQTNEGHAEHWWRSDDSAGADAHTAKAVTHMKGRRSAGDAHAKVLVQMPILSRCIQTKKGHAEHWWRSDDSSAGADAHTAKVVKHMKGRRSAGGDQMAVQMLKLSRSAGADAHAVKVQSNK